MGQAKKVRVLVAEDNFMVREMVRARLEEAGYVVAGEATDEALDFIAVHTYPAWEYRSIHDALEYTKQNYHSVVAHYPGKPVIITEAGWTTAANGRGIEPHNASEELQASYYEQLVEWTTREEILTFVFEAFDEPWKGSPDLLEPEKHWGLFRVDRTPKLVMAVSAAA